MAAVAFIVEVGIPLGAAVYFWRRRDGTFWGFLVGVLGFYISQPVLRLPLMSLLRAQAEWFAVLPYTNRGLYFLFLAFTAGLFEESARWLGMRFFRKGRMSWMDGLAYGLGHGGCEAAWLFFTQIFPAAMAGQLQTMGAALGAFERIFTMLVQLGLTFVVLQSLRKKKLTYLFLAIGIHTAVDFLIIIGNVWILEGLIAAEGVAALIYVLRLKRQWSDKKERLYLKEEGL